MIIKYPSELGAWRAGMMYVRSQACEIPMFRQEQTPVGIRFLKTQPLKM